MRVARILKADRQNQSEQIDGDNNVASSSAFPPIGDGEQDQTSPATKRAGRGVAMALENRDSEEYESGEVEEQEEVMPIEELPSINILPAEIIDQIAEYISCPNNNEQPSFVISEDNDGLKFSKFRNVNTDIANLMLTNKRLNGFLSLSGKFHNENIYSHIISHLHKASHELTGYSLHLAIDQDSLTKMAQYYMNALCKQEILSTTLEQMIGNSRGLKLGQYGEENPAFTAASHMITGPMANHLKELVIDDLKLSESQICDIVNRFHDLEKLSLNGKITNESVKKMLPQLSKLQSISLKPLGNDYEYKDEMIKTVIDNCKNLKHIKLDNIQFCFTTELLEYIADTCPDLISLEIEAFCEEDDNALIKVVNKCNNLKELVISSSFISDAFIKELSKLSNLEKILLSPYNSLDNDITSDSIISLIQSCTKLREISLEYCYANGVISAIATSECANNIEKVAIDYNTPISAEEMEILFQSCPKLKVLDITCRGDIKFMDVVNSIITNTPTKSLERLIMPANRDNKIAIDVDAILLLLTHCSNLKEINLCNHNIEIDDEQLVNIIQSSKSLERIVVGDYIIEPEKVEEIRKSGNLSCLATNDAPEVIDYWQAKVSILPTQASTMCL